MSYTTINKSSSFQNQVLYTGNGSTQSITGVGFKPDWVWVKQRGGTTNHKTSDIVRGVTKAIQPNDVDAEATDSNGITSFDSDGFSLGNGGDYNGSSNTQVAWNWLAGGSQGSSNTAGSINTTYTSVNTTAGFSISTYTGTGANATVGHGLGVAPKMILLKNLGASSDWRVFHQDIGNTKWLQLNDTSTPQTSSTMWNDTSPTNQVFSIGTSGGVNTSSGTYVAYCFAEKTGYSKFGQYTGNGNGNGAFVYTGFKPSFVIIKRTDTADVWTLWDNKRLGYNPNNSVFEANNSNAEASSDRLEIISNGFKLRYNWTPINSSGGTYVYMAFGQSIVGSNNIPNNAR